jgi:putative FmdB family regulatory protein
MPTYEYVCTKCGEGLEAVQSFNDPPLTKCPRCKGKLRKVFSAAGIVFKGSGFYKTDSRSGSKSPTAPSKEPAAANGAKTESGGASKESSKPAASEPSSSPSPTDSGSKVA